MILCNTQVHAALDDGRLVISPEPTPRLLSVGGPHCPYDTHTVDLKLFNEIAVPNPDLPITIDLARPGKVFNLLDANSDTFTLTEQQGFTLQPNTFVLGRTLEEVILPYKVGCETCLAARIEGKSSRARVGLLIHFTAPTVHPGWKGPLVLEMINLGPWPILLTKDMYIAQLIVEEVRGCPNANQSDFQNQSTATGVSRDGHAQRQK